MGERTTFRLGRGINLGGWLSQSKRRGAERRAQIGRGDIERIADWGLDHIRLPVDEEQLWDADGRREPEAWDLMNAALDWAEACGLRVVVDLHILRSHSFNAPQRPLFTDPAAPAAFAGLWRDLSAGLRGRRLDRVAYELLNEAVADDPADWNRAYAAPYRALREAEPTRTIVLGSNLWNQPGTFEHLSVPAGDPRLVLTFHYYSPMFVTHYRANWVAACAAYEGPVQYPGLPIPQESFDALAPDVQSRVAGWNRHHDRAVMAADLLWPLAVSRRSGLPLYCGEFGAIHRCDPAPRQRWHRDLVDVLEAHGIGWAVWSYKGGFGMTDAEGAPLPEFEGMIAAWR